MSEVPATERFELRLDRAGSGGVGVGRDESGRVVFAEGGLPGETVVVELEQRKKRYARGRVVEVVVAAAGRREPPCPTGRSGCGGCDLAHADAGLQTVMKQTVVRDALERIGRVDRVPDIEVSDATGDRYRTTVRAAVRDGRAGYRRRRSHDIVHAEICLVAHPLVEDLLAHGRWGSAAEVTLRASASTGERLAIVDSVSLEGVSVADDVSLCTRRDVGSPSAPAITEYAGGRGWRVSAGSFFQAGPAAASALVAAVGRAVAEHPLGRMVDAYAGIGLFAGTVGTRAEQIVAIERSASSAADARFNLGGEATVIEDAVEFWTPMPADTVIADPARAGLGRKGVEVLERTGAERFVLVSCDPGSLGRDVGLLVEAGFTLDSVEMVDAFADTSHVETVVGLTR